MALAESMAISSDASFDQKIFFKYRKFIAIFIPFVIAQVIWFKKPKKYLHNFYR